MSSRFGTTDGITNRIRVFGDESGCTGFNKLGSGSTPFFIVALVVTDDVDGFRSAITRYRSSLSYPPREFHFHGAEPEHSLHMLKFLNDRKAISFEACALVVDKVNAAQTGAAPKSNEAYEHYVAMAFSNHRQRICNAIVRMDKSNHGGKGVLSRIKKAVNTDPTNPVIHDIEFEQSHGSDGVQVADIICGALWQKYRHKRPEYLDCIRKRVHIVER